MYDKHSPISISKLSGNSAGHCVFSARFLYRHQDFVTNWVEPWGFRPSKGSSWHAKEQRLINSVLLRRTTIDYHIKTTTPYNDLVKLWCQNVSIAGVCYSEQAVCGFRTLRTAILGDQEIMLLMWGYAIWKPTTTYFRVERR